MAAVVVIVVCPHTWDCRHCPSASHWETDGQRETVKYSRDINYKLLFNIIALNQMVSRSFNLDFLHWLFNIWTYCWCIDLSIKIIKKSTVTSHRTVLGCNPRKRHTFGALAEHKKFQKMGQKQQLRLAVSCLWTFKLLETVSLNLANPTT